MLNKLPCLYGFISSTSEGNRNENVFKAINHLRKYNQTATIDDIIKEALSINKALQSPLPDNEVKVICQHVMAKPYKSSCWKFKHYCQHCRYGKFKKSFRNSNPKYRKYLNNNNRLVRIGIIPDDTYYPWDILDTSELTQEQRTRVQIMREQKGIPIDIDKIIKNYGISIGDKAKDEWERFKRGD